MNTDAFTVILRHGIATPVPVELHPYSETCHSDESSRRNPYELDKRDASLRRLRTLRGVPTA